MVKRTKASLAVANVWLADGAVLELISFPVVLAFLPDLARTADSGILRWRGTSLTDLVSFFPHVRQMIMK